ncbi:NAD(P)H-dependent oxidoreductase [Trinickia sp. YCB016]
MSVLLHISTSTRGDGSHSRRVGRALVEALRRAADVTLVTRDLAREPVPHADAAYVDAMLMPQAERGADEAAALTLSETLIEELEAADALVIDTPMHNFTVPSVLKAWVDHVVRVGRTFNVTPNGKVGLLRDRPVYVVIACGGSVAASATHVDADATTSTGSHRGQTDFITPYLRYVFATIGITEVRTLRLEALLRSDEEFAHAEAFSAQWIAAQAAEFAKLR